MMFPQYSMYSTGYDTLAFGLVHFHAVIDARMQL
jgi:hypothetical protein